MGLGTQIVFGFIAAGIALYYSGRSRSLIESIDKTVFGSYGCISADAIEELTLQYFKTRGRAEGIRMILEDNSVPYTEMTFSSDEWPAVKKKGIETGTFTFGQVPAITTKSGFTLVQSMAIIHYIGRSLGLDCDCEDYHLCEVIALGSEDLRSKFGKVIYDPKFSVESGSLYMYLTTVLPTWLEHFEKLAPEIKQESNDSFFIRDRLTWIDYIMFELIDSNMEFSKTLKSFLGGKAVKYILEDFPRLTHFFQTFYYRPKLQKYLVSDNRLPFKLPFPPSVVESKTS